MSSVAIPIEPALAKPRRSIPFRPYLLLVPISTVLLLFFALPMGMMIGLSFQFSELPGVTIENYQKLVSDDLVFGGIVRTIVMSGLVAICVTCMSFPVAYYLARTTSRFRSVVFALAIAPELAGIILRTYGWLIILEDRGFINDVLLWTGVVSAPLRLSNSMFGVVVGLTHVLLPFGILSLLTSIQGIDPNLERSAQILGASRLSVMRHIVIPLALPGIASSVLISFTLAASAYATPALLGGVNFSVLATMIYEQVFHYVNWPYAAAMANVLLIIVLAIAFVSSRIESQLHNKLGI
jgi:putative spermidine/putrescine transport system permease protein